MDQPPQEPTLEESITQVMQVLPPVIRNYLVQGAYTAVAQNLKAKYGLRIDQAGVLEREIMLLLMGIDSPDEFTKTLVEEAKIDQKVVIGIARDVNEQIFIPLREEEMKGGAGGVPQPPKPPAPPQAARVLPFQSPGTMIPANPQLPPREPVYMSNVGPAPARASARPASTEPLQGNKSLSPLAQAIGQATKEKAPPQSPSTAPSFASLPPKTAMPVRVVTDASKLLEDHEEPSLPIKTPEESRHTIISLNAYQPSQNPVNLISRPPAPRPAEAAFGSGAPANLPGAPAEELLPPAAPKPVPPVVRPPRPTAPAPAPAKPYSTDPYREPIET